MELIITTKQEKAVAILMKESILQVKEYIEEKRMREQEESRINKSFSLLFFMSEISIDWLNIMLNKIEFARNEGKVTIEDYDADRIKSLVDLYQQASDDMFFDPDLFDIAKKILSDRVEDTHESFTIRHLE